MLTFLVSLLAAVTLQVQHRQVPVLLDEDVAVAVVRMVDGADTSANEALSALSCKVCVLPRKALVRSFVRDSLLFVHVDSRYVRDLRKPFRLKLKARGCRIEESGEREHRLARAVRTGGDDGVAAYRIPGLVTTHSGSLIAVYDIRHASARDLQGDIVIGISRSTDGGLTWEPMMVAMSMGEYGGLSRAENGVGDPCILLDETTGDLMVFAAWVHGKGGKTAWWSAGDGFEPADTPQLLMVRSSDEGRTWSKPVNLTRQVKRPQWLFTFQAPGRGITMADGTLVVPFQHQEPDRTPEAGIMFSHDHGRTWQVSASAKTNTTESQVAEVAPGRLLLSIRDNRGTGRAMYETRDMGKTWTPHVADGQLPDPVCMASLLHVPASENSLGRDILLFANPADQKDRCNMTLRISYDGGVTWPGSVLLDEGESWGYSCLTMIDPATVGILYESSQAHITFQAIPLANF